MLNKMFDLEKIQKAHFIGIGGIGMSALARLFKSRDIQVTGSDSTESDLIANLREEGAAISIGENPGAMPDDIDCVIYTLAIDQDNNREFLKAQKLKTERDLPIFTYAEMLGKVSENMTTVAVAGTHGKTTTTAMLDNALRGVSIKNLSLI
jgi:UDP-N-acetylmuramate--alanine ligase